MSLSKRTAGWLAAGTLALSMALSGAVASAGATTAGTVVATGLNSPRGVAVATDGSIYVAEGGTGGPEVLSGAPNDPNATATRGYTGQITRIAPNGTKTVVADGLASYGGGEVVGPTGIVLAGGAIWVSIGGIAAEQGLTPLETENTVVKIDPATGAVTKIADIGAYEAANDPDGYGVNSNLYGMTLGADGNLYVADAGGNAIYRLNPNTGAFSVLAVLPGVAVTAADFPPGSFPPDQPFGNPGRGGKPEVDPVPTSVTAGADGSLYVTLLPGALLPKKAGVVRVTMDGTVSTVATGFNTLVGSSAGPDGNLYVASLTAGFAENGPPAPGSVMRVANGQATVVASDLPFPNGIDFDAAGNLYVVTFTINPGPEPMGQVVRFDGVAPAAAPSPTPMPSPIPSPPATGAGGFLPGLPNTGAGGGGQANLPLAGLILAIGFGGSLFILRRREA